MKKMGIILMVTVLLALSAFAGKKKPQDIQDSTDWLNAPTPDGSPTLKETSDWLAKTLQDYGGYFSDGDGAVRTIQEVRIDNNCMFSYTTVSSGDNGRHTETTSTSLPLGAVSEVIGGNSGHPNPSYWGGEDEYGKLLGFEIKTGQMDAVQNHGRRGSVSPVANEAAIDVSNMPKALLGHEDPQKPYQMIPRIVSALQHAVSLCQSAYKAPAQTKEPF
jgi:hypothetical protein